MFTHTKKTPFIIGLGLTLLCLYPVITNAQSSPTEPAPVSYRKNLVKLNLGGLALKSYNFSFERLLSKKISFVAGYNTMSENKLSDLPLIKKASEKLLDEEDDIKNDFDKITAANKAYTAEFRFYTGSHPGARGFYVALYGRYNDTKINYAYDYETNSKTYHLPVKSKITGFGGGLLLGTQFIIAKRVALDFYFGGHYGKSKGNADALADLSTMTPEEKADLKNELESKVEISGKQYLTATVTNEGVNAKADGPLIGLRGGLSLGIAF
ncbi:hypothetical protein HDC92_003103 [Pedobacter sp. AK017]|uniref:DUF3575 domain-containing protein n=1 Tax=Pedobacter sp. AK017 TaxID=2723073 RepID=UPI0016101983|nr:DUF3575 domain-containing protein [Pedobacter sp. AK017]MBB5439410.1 hypothetical protein [Pedobacter sp. AK017]